MTTIESRKFNPKNTKINAVQWTGQWANYRINGKRIALIDNDLGNGPNFASWHICDKCKRQTDAHGRLYRNPKDEHSVELVCPGGWIVESPSGELSVLSDAAFRASFDEVSKETVKEPSASISAQADEKAKLFDEIQAFFINALEELSKKRLHELYAPGEWVSTSEVTGINLATATIKELKGMTK